MWNSEIKKKNKKQKTKKKAKRRQCTVFCKFEAPVTKFQLEKMKFKILDAKRLPQKKKKGKKKSEVIYVLLGGFSTDALNYWRNIENPG